MGLTSAPGVSFAPPPISLVSGGDGSIQLELVSVGNFTDGTHGAGGTRYIDATFKVRNAQADGMAYSSSQRNLTFLAVSTAGTLVQSAISTLERFDGSDADPSIALQVQPTGAVHQDFGSRVTTDAGVLQVLTETDAASFTPPAGVTSVFPYGFVVHNASTPDSRSLPANLAAGQFDGPVTFAFKVPLQASLTDDPFTVSARFLAVDDGTTRVTQRPEEQTDAGLAAFQARADAINAHQLTLLPGGSALLGTGIERVVCTVRTAGAAGSPTATLDLPSANEPWLLPAPLPASPTFLPRTALLGLARCPDIPTADASSFVVAGFQSGYLTGSFFGAGNSLVRAPVARNGAFFPGEEVEVTLTSALGGSAPMVARYRVAATGGTGSFTSLGAPSVGDGPYAVAAGDLDGDGDVDLATVNYNANTVSILQNDGAGVFTPLGAAVTVGAQPFELVAADPDGDGDLDLAVRSDGLNAVSILRNDGAGGSTAVADTAAGRSPAGVIAADLDANGDLDLAVTDMDDNIVTLLRNDGVGSLPSMGSPAVGSRPFSVAAADMDGDGDLDLATPNFGTSTVTVLRNDGGGSFSTFGTMVAVGADPFFIATADFDGDGDMDLATADNGANTVSLLRNQ